jgi:EAL domain-containing protein (putative c-di-GMP-specific phosphodiesterase class I)
MDQAAFLHRHGCNLVQGYFRGSATPGRDVLKGKGTLVRNQAAFRQDAQQSQAAQRSVWNEAAF